MVLKGKTASRKKQNVGGIINQRLDKNEGSWEIENKMDTK